MQSEVIEPIWGREVGRIIVDARLENLADLAIVARGAGALDEVRSIALKPVRSTLACPPKRSSGSGFGI